MLAHSTTRHLRELMSTVDRLAGLVADAEPDPDVVAAQMEVAAEASFRLDGGSTDASANERGTWLDAFGLHEAEQDFRARELELEGVRAALLADDLAPRLFDTPSATLADLHGLLTRGLVAHAGVLRSASMAVHDARFGRMIFRAVNPEHVPDRIERLAAWLAADASTAHGLVVSGVVHYELLAIHPFEVANGRLARAASRLVLRLRDLDPHRLAGVETVLLEDPIGYYAGVAATQHRDDLTVWLERWGEAVCESLRRSARLVGALPTERNGRERALLHRIADHRFTLADWSSTAEVDLDGAREDLETLLDAGAVRRVLGSRGLRFEKENADGVS